MGESKWLRRVAIKCGFGREEEESKESLKERHSVLSLEGWEPSKVQHPVLVNELFLTISAVTGGGNGQEDPPEVPPKEPQKVPRRQEYPGLLRSDQAPSNTSKNIAKLLSSRKTSQPLPHLLSQPESLAGSRSSPPETRRYPRPQLNTGKAPSHRKASHTSTYPLSDPTILIGLPLEAQQPSYSSLDTRNLNSHPKAGQLPPYPLSEAEYRSLAGPKDLPHETLRYPHRSPSTGKVLSYHKASHSIPYPLSDSAFLIGLPKEAQQSSLDTCNLPSHYNASHPPPDSLSESAFLEPARRLAHDIQQHPPPLQDTCKLPLCLKAGHCLSLPISTPLANARTIRGEYGTQYPRKRAAQDTQKKWASSRPYKSPKKRRPPEIPILPAIIVCPPTPKILDDTYQPRLHSKSAPCDFVIPVQSCKDTTATLQVPPLKADKPIKIKRKPVPQREVHSKVDVPTKRTILPDLQQPKKVESKMAWNQKPLPALPPTSMPTIPALSVSWMGFAGVSENRGRTATSRQDKA